MTKNEICNIISHVARVGEINLDALETPADVAIAARWSSHFHEAVRGLDLTLVWSGIEKAKAKGARTFRPGVGLWLTEREALGR